jgi:hypothetical protein
MKTDISDKYLLSAFRFWPNFAVKSTSCCKVQDLTHGSDTGCCDWIFLLLVRQSEVKRYLKRNRDQSLPYLFFRIIYRQQMDVGKKCKNVLNHRL